MWFLTYFLTYLLTWLGSEPKHPGKELTDLPTYSESRPVTHGLLIYNTRHQNLMKKGAEQQLPFAGSTTPSGPQ